MHNANLRPTRILIGFLGLIWCGLNSTSLLAQSSLPTEEEERRAIEAFKSVHDGWSVDEVLLQDELRERFFIQLAEDQFTKNQLAEGMSTEEKDRWSKTLIHVRKSGNRLPKSTRRTSLNTSADGPASDRSDAAVPTGEANAQIIEPKIAGEGSVSTTNEKENIAHSEPILDSEQLIAVAEISARRLFDEFGLHTDALLYDSKARECFDNHAQSLAEGISTYEIRKAAIRLRKTRQLEPELLSRVTEWNRTIENHLVSELRLKLADLPDRPGIYIFHDSSGYLYIGQANDLKERLTKHLSDSDRKGLASYLSDSADSQIYVEMHVFRNGSPGEDLRIRRAYESELIRTRKPRFNVAP